MANTILDFARQAAASARAVYAANQARLNAGLTVRQRQAAGLTAAQQSLASDLAGGAQGLAHQQYIAGQNASNSNNLSARDLDDAATGNPFTGGGRFGSGGLFQQVLGVTPRSAHQAWGLRYYLDNPDQWQAFKNSALARVGASQQAGLTAAQYGDLLLDAAAQQAAGYVVPAMVPRPQFVVLNRKRMFQFVDVTSRQEAVVLEGIDPDLISRKLFLSANYTTPAGRQLSSRVYGTRKNREIFSIPWEFGLPAGLSVRIGENISNLGNFGGQGDDETLYYEASGSVGNYIGVNCFRVNCTIDAIHWELSRKIDTNLTDIGFFIGCYSELPL